MNAFVREAMEDYGASYNSEVRYEQMSLYGRTYYKKTILDGIDDFRRKMDDQTKA